MSELIDREALLDECLNHYEVGNIEQNCTMNWICKTVRNAQTIDAVQVVRCKDCKHRDPEDHGCDCAGHEMLMGGLLPMPDNWFCADAVRKSE